MSSAAPSLSSDRVPLGIVMMLAFCAIAPLIDVSSKIAVQSVSIAQVTLFRMIFQAVLMAPVVLVLRQSMRLRPRLVWLQVLRSVMLIGSTAAFVGAVREMPLADALAIVFIEPFIILAMGAFLFGDQVGPRRIVAAVVGFLGSLLVIQPNFAQFGLVALYPLATALFFAFYMLLTRRVAREVPPEAMQLHTAWMGVVLMAPVLALGYAGGVDGLALSNPEPAIWGWLFGVGLAASVSHMAMTYALRWAPSATLAPLHYLEIVNAVLFGYLFFDDWPNALSWAGIVVIVASGLYVIARERALARKVRLPGPV